MIAKIFKKIKKIIHSHGVSFTTKEKAQILVDHQNGRNLWRTYKVKRCIFCKKYYSYGKWTKTAIKIRRKMGYC